MKCSNFFYAIFIVILTGISDKLRAIQQILPHTVKFKNISYKKQLIWINSEYTVTPCTIQPSKDHICKALAPGEAFVYGNKEYFFTRLDVRLNPTQDMVLMPHFYDGFIVTGLTEPVSKITIFDDDTYTISNKKSLTLKLLRNRLKTQAARKMVDLRFVSTGKWHHAQCDSAEKNSTKLFLRNKKSMHRKQELNGHAGNKRACDNTFTANEHHHDKHDEVEVGERENHTEEEEEDELEEEEKEASARARRRGTRPLRRSLHGLKKKLFAKNKLKYKRLHTLIDRTKDLHLIPFETTASAGYTDGGT